MKKIVMFLFITGMFFNCSKSEDMEIISANEEDPIINQMTETIFSMGNFISGAHPTSGNAAIGSNKSTLSLKNFKTDNGPKLLVYLSTDIASSEFISLGDLKGIEGDFNYNIPQNTDLEKYKIVNIWCVDFSVSFGHAELKIN